MMKNLRGNAGSICLEGVIPVGRTLRIMKRVRLVRISSRTTSSPRLHDARTHRIASCIRGDDVVLARTHVLGFPPCCLDSYSDFSFSIGARSHYTPVHKNPVSFLFTRIFLNTISGKKYPPQLHPSPADHV